MKKLINRRKFAISLIWGYFLILLIPIVASAIGFVSYNKFIRKEIVRGHEKVLTQTRQTFDQGFNELYLVAQQLLLNKYFLNFSNIHETSIPKTNKMDLYMFAKDTASLDATLDFLDDIYIYFPNSHSYVGSGTYFTEEDFTKLVLGKNNIQPETWASIINESSHKDMLSLGEEISFNRKLIQIFHISYPSTKNHQYLIGIVNPNRFSWQNLDAKSSNKNEDSQLLFLDKEGSLLYQKGDVSLTEEDIDAIRNSSQPTTMELDGRKFVVSVVPSSLVNVDYCVLTPSDIFWKSSRLLNVILLVTCFLALFMGGFLIIVLFKRQYSPVQELLQYLESHNTGRRDVAKNEMDYIASSVKSINRNQNSLTVRLENQNQYLRQFLLNRILQGDLDENFSTSTEFPDLDLMFPYEQFRILVFYLDSYGDDLTLAQFVLQNIYEELISERYTVYTTKQDGLIIGIVNNPNMDNDALEEWMSATLNKTRETLKNYFEYDFHAVISECIYSLKEWSGAYVDCSSELSSLLASAKAPGVFFVEKGESQPFSLENFNLQKISNLCELRQYEDLRLFLDDILSPDKAVQYERESAYFLNFQVLLTLLRALENTTRQILMVEEPMQKLIQRLQRQQDTRPLFRELLKRISTLQPEESESSATLADRIDAYIATHYQDPDLNLAALGQAFDITPNYLARLYKENKPVALLDALNYQRVIQAKKMLTTLPDANLSDVADQCGFTNVNTFIRVFKKFEGVTPGRFRSITNL